VGRSNSLLVFATLALGCHLLTGVDDLETGEEPNGTGTSTNASTGTGAGGTCTGAVVDLRPVIADNYMCAMGQNELADGPGLSLSRVTSLSAECRVLLQTDLGPASSGLATAEVCLQQLVDAGTLGRGTAAAHPLVFDWTEDGVNWTQARPEAMWANAGGDFDPIPVGITSLAPQDMGEVCWDIRAHVDNVWINGYPDFGVILVPTDGDFVVRFRSSEALMGNVPTVKLTFCP
jgi:hypothetical protein